MRDKQVYIVKFMSGNVLDFELLYTEKMSRYKLDQELPAHYHSYFDRVITPLLKLIEEKHGLNIIGKSLFRTPCYIHVPHRLARVLAVQEVSHPFFGKDKSIAKWNIELLETINHYTAQHPTFADYLASNAKFSYPSSVYEVREVKL